jgi:hypothetical protein
MVFDEALHNGPKEPGYYASLKKGCEFASKHLAEGSLIDPNFYMQLHHELCTHFKGAATETTIGADKIDCFRDTEEGCLLWNADFFPDANKEQAHSRIKEMYELIKTRESLAKEGKNNNPHSLSSLKRNIEWEKRRQKDILEDYQSYFPTESWWESALQAIQNYPKDLQTRYDEMCQKVTTQYEQKSKQWLENFYAEKPLRISSFNQKIEQAFHDFGLDVPPCAIGESEGKDFAWLYSRELPQWQLTYHAQSAEEIKQSVITIFAKYNELMQEINAKMLGSDQKEDLMEQKLELIAKLFQMLEWLHPFFDGQGRADLVLLSTVLTKEGFNPPILEQPYMSSYSSLKDWINYLRNGTERWKKLRAEKR